MSSLIVLYLFPLAVRLVTPLRMVSPEAFIGYVQTISNDVAQTSHRLVSSLISHVCYRFEHDLLGKQNAS
jgi:hypothetical protein